MLRLVFGYWVDSKTGECFSEEWEPQPFTFEPEQGNPFNFATRKTAEKMLTWCRAQLNSAATLTIEPGVWQELQIVIAQGDNKVTHNAGLLASQIMRNSAGVARDIFRANNAAYGIS